MKVFKNERNGGYCGGIALVAANNANEAHETLCKAQPTCVECFNSDGYWVEMDSPNCVKKEHYYYRQENWEEVPFLHYDTDKPCLIAENGYTE